MSRTRWALLAILCFCVCAAWVGGTRHVGTRLLSRQESVRVLAGSGQWYHRYTLRFIDSAGSAVRDTFTVAVSREQFDGMRVGARVRVGFLAPIPKITWIADSTSALRTMWRTLGAQFRSYHSPRAISPLMVPTPGLARVVAITNIEQPRAFWERDRAATGAARRWIQVIEVEFWAPRSRSLVHAVDVIDAGSIPGLRLGDVLEMHFDARDPRTFRIDDGTRSFTASWRQTAPENGQL